MQKPVALLLALCTALLAAALHAENLDVTVVTLDGDEQPQKLTGVSEAGFKFAEGELAAKDVAELRFSDAKESSELPVFVLRNGDRLKAEIVSGDDTRFKLKSPALGDLALENKFVSTVLFPLKSGPGADALENFVKSAPPKEDMLLLPKGDTLSGFMEKFTDKEIVFNAGGQSRPYAFAQLAAFRMAPLDAYKAAEGFRASLSFKDGSAVTGKLLGLKDGKLQFEALNGATWAVPASALQNIRLTGGKLVYLSDLAPKAVEEKPYVGGMPVIYHWRKDRTVTGEDLTLGAHTYSRGVGVHSYSKLTYDLNGQYAKFLADAGLDAAAPASAACAWKILLDGKEVCGGTLKNHEKTPVKVDASGAKTLELICDYGPDDDDAGDQFDWANARLIKP